MPFAYNPDKDIPDLTGKAVLITGGLKIILSPF